MSATPAQDSTTEPTGRAIPHSPRLCRGLRLEHPGAEVQQEHGVSRCVGVDDQRNAISDGGGESLVHGFPASNRPVGQAVLDEHVHQSLQGDAPEGRNGPAPIIVSPTSSSAANSLHLSRFLLCHAFSYR